LNEYYYETFVASDEISLACSEAAGNPITVKKIIPKKFKTGEK